MLMGKTIGFFGAGSMAEALIRGLIASGQVTEDQVTVTNRSNDERLAAFRERLGVSTTRDKSLVAGGSDILVLAVKPKDMSELLAEIGPLTRHGQVVISVAAGLTTESLKAAMASGVQVVRAMPNTSCQVRESATAVSPGEGAGREAVEVATSIFWSVGRVVEVTESMLDVVTGLSGSGPAYVYVMIEALTEAGTRAGLEPEIALELATQTVFGAAKMIKDTGENPATLRHRVMSPGGTTVAGLQELADRGFAQSLGAAVARAAGRAKELGRNVTAATS